MSSQIGCEVFHNLKKVIKEKFGGDATLIGDEGGFAPPCDVKLGMEMLMQATDIAGCAATTASSPTHTLQGPFLINTVLPMGYKC